MAQSGSGKKKNANLNSKKKAAATDNDFDLDAFLKENDFLPAEDDKKDEKDEKNGTDARKSSADTKENTTDASKSSADAEDDKKDEKVAADTSKSATDARKNTTNASKSSAKTTRKTAKTSTLSDDTKTAPKAARTTKNDTPSTQDTEIATEKPSQDSGKADPNATMSYAALGEEYPEIPLVDETTTTDKEVTPTPKKTSARKIPRVSSTTVSSSSDRETTSVGNRETASPKSTPVSSSRSKTTASEATPPARRSRTGKSAPVKKQAVTPAVRSTSRATKRSPALKSLAKPEDFQSAKLNDNSYRIRGGGKRHNRPTPVMTILIAVVIIAGLGLLGYALNTVLNDLLGEKPTENVITLSADDTRSAIDAEMPQLIDVIWLSSEEATASFVESGWNVFANERMTSDNPDRSSTGNEIVHLNAEGTEDSLKGYYESEFNAYDFDELQAIFNGAWMLDLSSGDSGRYAQIKYLNFAADSLEAEMTHLRELQGLIGEFSVIDSEGQDGYENTYIQGYTVVGETTYYWKLIGIGFNDLYRGQDKRNVPDTCVYVKCTVATFDFYGAGEGSFEDAESTEDAETVDVPAEEEVPAEEGASEEEATEEEY